MDNWEHREKKLSARKHTKAMTKPFKRKNELDYENKKRTKIKIKQAQKEKLLSLNDINDLQDDDNI